VTLGAFHLALDTAVFVNLEKSIMGTAPPVT